MWIKKNYPQNEDNFFCADLLCKNLWKRGKAVWKKERKKEEQIVMCKTLSKTIHRIHREKY